MTNSALKAKRSPHAGQDLLTHMGVIQMTQFRFLPSLGAIVFAVILATPLSAQATRPKATSHDLAGRDNCLMCHTAGAMEPGPDVPATHEGRTNEMCQWCHAADSPMITADPAVIAHDLAGRDNCLMCHTAGAMEPVPDVPASHAGRANEQCQMCHKPAGS